MATAEAALDYYRSQLGIGEHPPGSNCNAITARCGLGCVAWCAETWSLSQLNAGFGSFGSMQMAMPGLRPDYAWGWAYVPSLRSAFAAAGRYDTSARIGDAVIFGWSPGSAGDHVGIVESIVGDGTYVTLEGNHNDDCVRMRRSSAVILGFCHPPYDAAPPPPPPNRKELAVSDLGIARRLWLSATGAGYELDNRGGLHPLGGAPSASGGPYWDHDIARGLAVRPDLSGGYVLDGQGGISPFATGSAPLPPKPANGPYWDYDVARDLVITDWAAPAGYVLDAKGGIHPFGGAAPVTGGPYWP